MSADAIRDLAERYLATGDKEEYNEKQKSQKI